MRRGGSFFARIVIATMLVLSALLAVSAILVRESGAEGISGYLEFYYYRADIENTTPGGRSIETKSDTFTQLYSITLDRKLYPNLTFLASANFLDRDTSIDVEGLKIDTTTTTLRPYVNLNLRTPLYYAEAAYGRIEEKEKTAGFSLTTVRDAFVSTLYWKPDRFPDLKLQYLWDHRYDKERLTVDTVSNLFLVTSNYLPVENLRLYYQGTFRDTDLRLSDTTVKETIHNGRVYYSNNWWRRRITFGGDYNITNQAVESTTTGIGEVGLQVFPFFGLSKSSDTPGNVVLDSNPALIDPDLEASAGINLGSRSGDSQLRNMGMDFLAVTELNTLYVSVDRDVAQVADAFSWRIYTSDDNPSDGIQIWIPGQIVSPAIYSPTFKRFEIRFANVTARFVKVVTAPLSLTVPSASAYPDIFVTGIQAEIRRPASEVAGKETSTFQNGTADLRALLVESVNLTYEFTYVFTKRDPGEMFYTVSNGLSFFRQFNRVFSGSGRIAFENGEEQAGSREALVYSASLTAVPLRTFRSSLLFSGRDETVAGKGSTTNSIFLYNVATLYTGIDANLSGGVSFQEDDTGRETRNTQGSAGVTFVPNRKVTLTLFYNGTTTVTSGGEVQGETTNYTRTGEADLSITPVQNVYLFGSYRIENSTTSPSRNILNYNLNWSPFPDGTLHLTFYYTETIRSDNTEERSIIPNLRWYFTPRSYLDLSYENLKVETPALTTRSNIYSGTVRITF